MPPPPLFWIDTGVLIQSWRSVYAPDVVPGFWESLKRGVTEGLFRSPRIVLAELEEKEDELTAWVKGNIQEMFVPSGPDVQAAFAAISAHVQNGGYNPAYATKFLDDADGWLIAHAQAQTGQVVTWELDRRRSRVKIPEVAKHFNVTCCDAIQLLRARGVRLQVS
jgi:hypothetical protein